MRELKSQQLTSFYLAVFIIAFIAVWLLSAGKSQQKVTEGRTLCIVKAKPEFQLKISFNPQYQRKHFSRNLVKKAYPFKIIAIIKSSSPACIGKIGKIFPVYLSDVQRTNLPTQSLVQLILVLHIKSSLVRTSWTTWQLGEE